ncbi:DUF7220 family protein [Rhodovulum marinum]|uniref:Uncharacterized protein n=1 Tax=Rhodovulum marinum TaxID=320662 RepID=A0A4R2QAK7_9RHOB|nr:hypothetical protein [Rhodovulum marinum]TCP43921.1 hypothetical protein EV662_1014 [Rhodovulum marinum]
MRGQTRRASLVEALVNIVAGSALAFALNMTVLPALGVGITAAQSLAATAAFTVASLARSYALRRLFNYWSTRT